MWGGAVKNLLSYFFVAIHPLHHASDSVDETKNTRSNIIILPKNTAPTIITPPGYWKCFSTSYTADLAQPPCNPSGTSHAVLTQLISTAIGVILFVIWCETMIAQDTLIPSNPQATLFAKFLFLGSMLIANAIFS